MVLSFADFTSGTRPRQLFVAVLALLTVPGGESFLCGPTSLSIRSARASRWMCSVSRGAQVALTRELGKNDKLAKLLAEKGFQTSEVPCIAFEEGEDAPKLPGALKEDWEWVVVTSPEAADVFLQGWVMAGKPDHLRLASVGSATADALEKGGIRPAFVPSKATGKTLAAELPLPSGNAKVLYPASSRAQTEVQAGLSERGFTVTRLNTYDTVSAIWSPKEEEMARAAGIVTLASPSAVKTWAERVGVSQAAACIGETSAAACKELGFKKVFWPEKPGMPGWVNAVEDAAKEIGA